MNIAREVGKPSFNLWRFELRGSQTRVVGLAGGGAPEVLPLHCAGQRWKTSFNSALCALAACGAELADFARRADPTMVLPHPIHRNLVGGLSVQYYSSTEAAWTHALKLLLIDLKWLESWRVKWRRLAAPEEPRR